MSFIDQFNKGFQKTMSMRSPEVMKRMPEVEAMSYPDRVALVKRGLENVTAIVRNWAKFADILLAQGMPRVEVRKRNKNFKAAKGHLDHALRLTDPGLPEPFKPRAEQAFNVLAAWFLVDAGYLESVVRGPKITSAGIATLQVPVYIGPPAASVEDSSGIADETDELVGPDIIEVEMDGPMEGARGVDESVDVLGRDEEVHLKS